MDEYDNEVFSDYTQLKNYRFFHFHLNQLNFRELWRLFPGFWFPLNYLLVKLGMLNFTPKGSFQKVLVDLDPKKIPEKYFKLLEENELKLMEKGSFLKHTYHQNVFLERNRFHYYVLLSSQSGHIGIYIGIVDLFGVIELNFSMTTPLGDDTVLLSTNEKKIFDQNTLFDRQHFQGYSISELLEAHEKRISQAEEQGRKIVHYKGGDQKIKSFEYATMILNDMIDRGFLEEMSKREVREYLRNQRIDFSEFSDDD